MPEIPRTFTSIGVGYALIREYVREGNTRQRDWNQVLVAVADDGTAWINGAPHLPEGWHAIVPLPPRTDG